MDKYMDKFRLDGKIAYVLGGTGLIGEKVSIAFASAGAKTVLLDVNYDKGQNIENKLRAKMLNVKYCDFDCSQLEKIDKNYLKLIKEYGIPDVFINCSYPRTEDWGESAFRSIKLKSFRENVDIHMNSYAWLARLSAEVMSENDQGGSIIQLSSIYGIVGQDLTVYEGTDMHENMTYAAIKGGITNLTRLMASYYGKYNIRVNTLCAGGLVGHVAGTGDTQDPIFIKQFSKINPLKRLGEPQEIASVALFLASDASSYITGATIMVDGGWTSI